MTNLSTIIDQIGQLEAQKAKLEREVKAMKAALEELTAGRYEGERFALTVSEFETTTYDNEAIRAHDRQQPLGTVEQGVVCLDQRTLGRDLLAAALGRAPDREALAPPHHQRPQGCPRSLKSLDPLQSRRGV